MAAQGPAVPRGHESWQLTLSRRRQRGPRGLAKSLSLTCSVNITDSEAPSPGRGPVEGNTAQVQPDSGLRGRDSRDTRQRSRGHAAAPARDTGPQSTPDCALEGEKLISGPSATSPPAGDSPHAAAQEGSWPRRGLSEQRRQRPESGRRGSGRPQGQGPRAAWRSPRDRHRDPELGAHAGLHAQWKLPRMGTVAGLTVGGGEQAMVIIASHGP